MVQACGTHEKRYLTRQISIFTALFKAGPVRTSYKRWGHVAFKTVADATSLNINERMSGFHSEIADLCNHLLILMLSVSANYPSVRDF